MVATITGSFSVSLLSVELLKNIIYSTIFNGRYMLTEHKQNVAKSFQKQFIMYENIFNIICIIVIYNLLVMYPVSKLLF